MNGVRYFVGGSIGRVSDAALGEPTPQKVAESVVDTISTSLQVTLAGKTVHLAMLMDPDHWDEDWRSVGVEDPYEFVAGLQEEL